MTRIQRCGARTPDRRPEPGDTVLGVDVATADASLRGRLRSAAAPAIHGMLSAALRRLVGASGGRGIAALAIALAGLGCSGPPAPTAACTPSNCARRGLICDAARGACVACLEDAHCPRTERCSEGACVPACGGGAACVAAGLVCDRSTDTCVACLVDSDCRPPDVTCRPVHVCTSRARCRETGCPTGRVCHEAWDFCVECVGDGDCTGSELCRGNLCVTRAEACELDLSCAALGLACDLDTLTCRVCPADGGCTAGADAGAP